jgi:hypothetical protein
VFLCTEIKTYLNNYAFIILIILFCQIITCIITYAFTKGAEFGIIQNGQELALVQIVPFHDSDTHNYHTGTGLAVAHLNQNDQIWIEVRHYDMHIFSCVFMY